MNMLVQFGVGLIMQAVQRPAQEAAQQQMLQQNNEWAEGLRQNMANATGMADNEGFDPFASPDFNAPETQPQLAVQDAPEFPQQSAENLQAMQGQHAEQLSTLSDQFLTQATALKSNFLTENHLATDTPAPTEDNPSPQPQVALDQNGKPQVQKGPEQPAQAQARQDYESTTTANLSDQHSTQTQQFVSQQKDNVQQFLADNKPDLTNPAVQQQLHNMLGSSQKKAWQLQTDQERELLKHDAYTPEMEANVDNYVNTKSSLVQQQNQEQEESPDAAALYQHQQDMAAMLQQQKDELQQSQQQSTFLTSAPKFGSAAATDEPVDVAKVLPSYLSDALYGMGIYQV